MGFLDVGLFLAVEANAYVAAENLRVVVEARGIDGERVGEGIGRCIVHGRSGAKLPFTPYSTRALTASQFRGRDQAEGGDCTHA